MNSMKHCGIINSIDGSEDDKIFCFNPGHSLDQRLSRLISSECALKRTRSCDEDVMAMNGDDDDDISWCPNDEAN